MRDKLLTLLPHAVRAGLDVQYSIVQTGDGCPGRGSLRLSVQRSDRYQVFVYVDAVSYDHVSLRVGHRLDSSYRPDRQLERHGALLAHLLLTITDDGEEAGLEAFMLLEAILDDYAIPEGEEDE